MFSVNAVTEQFAMNCPCCGRAVLLAFPDRSEVPGGGYWLDDGDSIPQLHHQLTEVQKTPSGFDHFLSVGKCPDCQQRYYAVLCNQIQGDWDTLDHYLGGTGELGEETNFVCVNDADQEGVPKQWLLREYKTEHGPLHEYAFGPFKLESTAGVIGHNGVSACRGGDNDAWRHAATLLHTIWDALRAHSQQRHAETAAG